MEDTTYNWESLLWVDTENPVAAPVSVEERNRVLPEEDVSKVVGLECSVCCDVVLYASTLQCLHMLCNNCAEDPRIPRCPHCQQEKKVKAVSHVASLVLARVSNLPDVHIARERIPSAALENPVPPPSTPPPLSRTTDAITAALRDDGIENPAEHLSEQRRLGRRERGHRRFRRNYTRSTEAPISSDSEDHVDPDQRQPNERSHSSDERQPEERPPSSDERQQPSYDAGLNVEQEDPTPGPSRQPQERQPSLEVRRSLAAEAAASRLAQMAGISAPPAAPAKADSMDEFDLLVQDATLTQETLFGGRPSRQDPATSFPADSSDGDESDASLDSMINYSQRTLRSGRQLIDGEPAPKRQKRAKRN